MDADFFYCAMWGALRGNLAYECADGGRDLMPMQMAIQSRVTRLYCQSLVMTDTAGGRVEGKLKSRDWQQQSKADWQRIS